MLALNILFKRSIPLFLINAFNEGNNYWDSAALNIKYALTYCDSLAPAKVTQLTSSLHTHLCSDCLYILLSNATNIDSRRDTAEEIPVLLYWISALL